MEFQTKCFVMLNAFRLTSVTAVWMFGLKILWNEIVSIMTMREFSSESNEMLLQKGKFDVLIA